MGNAQQITLDMKGKKENQPTRAQELKIKTISRLCSPHFCWVLPLCNRWLGSKASSAVCVGGGMAGGVCVLCMTHSSSSNTMVRSSPVCLRKEGLHRDSERECHWKSLIHYWIAASTCAYCDTCMVKVDCWELCCTCVCLGADMAELLHGRGRGCLAMLYRCMCRRVVARCAWYKFSRWGRGGESVIG